MPAELFDYIYDGDFYEINQEMIELILKAKDKFNEIHFNSRNYSAITGSLCEQLVIYIKENLNKYIVQVYLKLDGENHEDQDRLIELFNSDYINIENKIRIAKKVKTIVIIFP